MAYALPDALDLIHLTLPPGSTARQAVDASGLLQKHPELDPAKLKLGVYGKLLKDDAPLRDHDRVEIYRPLRADPKEARKKRVEDGKKAAKPPAGA